MTRLSAPLFVALLLGTLWPASAASQSLERAPYLQRTTPTQTTVVWYTQTPTEGSLSYGPSPGTLDTVVSSAGVSTRHEVTLLDLTPGVRTYYAVHASETLLAGGDADHFVETPPVAGSRTPFRAWVVGDSGTGGATQGRVRDAMLAHVGADRPDLYLHVGDMAYGSGTETEFTENFYAMYADILRNTTVWPAMGNHEGYTSDSGSQTGPYYSGYVLPTAGEAGGLPSGTEAYYSFDYANAHFIVLDSYETPREPDDAMLTWMAADLEATEQEWIVAYWHHPPYTKGSHDSDTETPLQEMRENALPILEAGGVDLVLGGHSHIYERSFLLDGAYETPSTRSGILDAGDGRIGSEGPYRKGPDGAGNEGAVYIVAGHGGTSVRGDGDHPLMYFSEVANGSVLLDFEANRLTVTNVRSDGTVTDRMALLKGSGVFLGAPDGGEQLAAGSAFDVLWASTSAGESVSLDFSCDGGETWSVVAERIPNTGRWTWDVPATYTGEGLMRVRSTADPSLSDTSNAVFATGVAAPTEVISFGDVWRYDDTGVDHGTAWLAADFDDSGWSSGPGQLGYGDGDEATELTNPSPNHPSHYFRHTFSLPGGVEAAELTLLYDDGAAVWINGVLAAAVNVEDGLAYEDWASSTSSDNATLSQSLDLSDVSLFEGENVVSVMIKQRNGTSSDISFDLALEVVGSAAGVEPCVPETGDDDDTSGDDDDTSGDDDDASQGDDDDTSQGDDDSSGDDDDTSQGDDDDTSQGDDDDSSEDDEVPPAPSGCSCTAAGQSPGGSHLAWLLLLAPLSRRYRP